MNINIIKYGAGFPLVLFHGWGFDSQIWKPLAQELLDYQLITVDLPGFGLSPMMHWEQFKHQLLQELPAQCAVAGWSLGGLYATRFALEEPQRISHLLNITSSPRFVMAESWPGVAPEVFAAFYQKLNQDTSATLKEFLDLQGAKNETSVFPDSLPSTEGLAVGLDILRTWDFRAALKELKLPACYMFGRLDPIVSVKTMNVMQELYPDFYYVFFKRAAHMPFLSHMDLFLTEIKGFIQ